MQAPDTGSLGTLPTEARNSNSTHIDELSTLDMLAVINREDQSVPLTVERELPQIARAVDAVAERFAQGGRLFYVGAGTSGRLGVLDASECPPTFSVAPTLFQGIIAGGDSALRHSSEHSEDSPEQGAEDLRLHGFGSVDDVSVPDTLVAIAASGRTPYVLGAIAYAKGLGCLTIGLSCVPGSALARAAEIAITPETGAEAITGSTRMKAGTATKLVLNMLSTGVMVRTGAVFGNLMVNVQPTNEKLIDRAERIVMAATGCGREEAARVLRLAQNDADSHPGIVKVAIVMQLLEADRVAAEGKLAAAKGVLRVALAKG
jgi:N-acetylmuramic acid 6-phosphate etherase